MNFKKIELNGFKSFADKTEIYFEQGVTAIVGPNGCGKSNVADSIRWVFGEQSAKTMRGSSMQDLIFNGTQTRKSQSFCEVTLIFDNSSKMFADLEYNEVSMTRRLFRDGDSEYLINKQPCLKRDIVDRLHSVGLGKDGYSIIGQGKIEQIMNAKPEDRRAIFEEATGIIMFKSKKQDIERRLNNSYNNLNIYVQRMEEVEKMLLPLAKAAEKTKKYLALYQELKVNEINLYIFKYDTAEETRTSIDKILKILCMEEEKSRERITSIEREYAQARYDIHDIDQLLQELNKKLLDFTVSMHKQDSEGKIITERINFYQKQIVQDENTIEKNIAKIDTIDTELENLQVKQEAEQSILQGHQKTLKVVVEQSNTYTQELHKNEILSNQTEQAFIDSIQNLSKMRQDISTLSVKKEAMQERYVGMMQECVDLKNREEQTISSLEEIQKELEQLHADVATESKKLAQKEEQIAITTVALEQCSEMIVSHNGKITNAKERANFFMRIKEEHEGYSIAVKKLLLESKKNEIVRSKIKGVIADIIKCKQEHEVAIETAFGAAMQNIITATADDARVLIEYLKKNKYGTITFLPVQSLKPRQDMLVTERAVKENGAIGLATTLVQFDSYYENIIRNLIGNTLIVDTILNATAIAKKYQNSFKIVTLDGDIIATSGSMTGGSRKEMATSKLANERKIDEVQVEIAELKDKLQKLVIKRNDLEVTRREDIAICASLRDTVVQIKSKIAVLHNKQESLQIANAELKEQMQKRQEEADELYAKVQGIEDAFHATAEGEEKLSQEYSSAEGETQQQKERIHALRTLLFENNTKQNELHQQIVNCNANLYNFEQEILRFQEEKKNLLDENVDKRKALAQMHENIQQLQRERDSIALTTEQQQMIDELRNKIEEQSQAKDNINVVLEKLMQENRELSEKLNEIALKKHKQELEVSKLMSELENLQVRIHEEYQEDYESCLCYKLDNFVPREGQSVIAKLKREINALGSINHTAMEEYEQLNAQYTEMQIQREDVQKGVDDTQKALDTLKSEMQQQFDSGFKEINENFQRLFKELFGGGRAELQMDYTDCTDPLSAGVEIVACPPGKKLTKISLMSGGERALTAIAILFAILGLRPMPFCVLDEIEAALDEANVDKFATFLKKFAKNTQFIVITHRKPTMEKADSLFGVTMEEKGVSKIVSVKVTEVQERLGGDTLQ